MRSIENRPPTINNASGANSLLTKTHQYATTFDKHRVSKETPLKVCVVAQPGYEGFSAACESQRGRFVREEKSRLGTTRLTDADYDRIANWMFAWKARNRARFGL